MNQYKNLKGLLVMGLFLLSGLFIIVILQINNRQSSPGKLIVQVAPLSSNISVNGRSVRSGTIAVPLGKSIVVVTKVGFASQTTAVTTNSNKAAYVGIVLEPNDSSTAGWYKNHPKDQQQFESISGNNLEVDSITAVNAQPILKLLPFTAAGLEFKVDYGKSPSGKKSQAIYITANSDAARQDALSWITNQGFLVKDIEVVYLTSSTVGDPTNNSNTSL